MKSDTHPDRQKAASLISRWMNHSISNYEFDDEWPYDSPDQVVRDIGRELWTHFSDNREMLLDPSVLSPDEISLLRRCLAFLQSDEEYEEVPYGEATPWKPGILGRLLRNTQRPWETMRVSVPPERREWWPFSGARQYERVVKGA